MVRPSPRASALVLTLVWSAGAMLAGQAPADTRAELIAREQAGKAARLTPYEPGKAEGLVRTAEEIMFSSPSGLYPYFGSVWSGGGLTLGAGYHQFYGDTTFWDVRGLYSLLNYKLIEASTRSPKLADGRLDVGVSLGWRSATQVAFFGLGPDTSPDDETHYGFTQSWVSGDAVVRPSTWARFKVGLGYEDFSQREGDAGSRLVPSIETIYTAETAPGLGANPKYLHTIAAAAVDWRPAAGYARTGGSYEVRYHNYADRDSLYSFDRVEAEAIQHVPILRETWVLSLHGLLESTLDGDVPHFLMPSVGGGSSLRGFESWRFRDRHGLLLQAEWRWTPNRHGLDMALFYDAGQVAGDVSALKLDNFEHNFGIGLRIHSVVATPLRIELARGREGFRLVFAGSAAF